MKNRGAQSLVRVIILSTVLSALSACGNIRTSGVFHGDLEQSASQSLSLPTSSCTVAQLTSSDAATLAKLTGDWKSECIQLDAHSSLTRYVHFESGAKLYWVDVTYVDSATCSEDSGQSFASETFSIATQSASTASKYDVQLMSQDNASRKACLDVELNPSAQSLVMMDGNKAIQFSPAAAGEGMGI